MISPATRFGVVGLLILTVFMAAPPAEASVTPVRIAVVGTAPSPAWRADVDAALARLGFTPTWQISEALPIESFLAVSAPDGPHGAWVDLRRLDRVVVVFHSPAGGRDRLAVRSFVTPQRGAWVEETLMQILVGGLEAIADPATPAIGRAELADALGEPRPRTPPSWHAGLRLGYEGSRVRSANWQQGAAVMASAWRRWDKLSWGGQLVARAGWWPDTPGDATAPFAASVRRDSLLMGLELRIRVAARWEMRLASAVGPSWTHIQPHATEGRRAGDGRVVPGWELTSEVGLSFPIVGGFSAFAAAQLVADDRLTLVYTSEGLERTAATSHGLAPGISLGLERIW